jgi:hypothetical protein
MAVERNPDVRAPDRAMEIHLTGNMERYMWSFDGVKLSDKREPIPFIENERVRVTLVNDTMMSHPIHLHGHFFELVTGHGEYSPRKHTVNVAPGGKVSFDVTADAVGDWAFHCHMLYHMHAGMMRVVSVRPGEMPHEVASPSDRRGPARLGDPSQRAVDAEYAGHEHACCSASGEEKAGGQASKPAQARRCATAKGKPATPKRRAPAAKPKSAPHDMSGMGAMSGMEMPGDKTPPTADPHAGHDMSGMPGMTMPDGAGGTMKHDMPGMDMQAAPGGQPMQHDMSSMPGMAMDGPMAAHGAGGTSLMPGNAPAPQPPTDNYADRVYKTARWRLRVPCCIRNMAAHPAR